MRLRLKMSDATVSASMTYGLETCPLTTKQLEQIDVTQRKMLRKLVGWQHNSEDSWEESGSRMKQRMESALALFPVATWSHTVSTQKADLTSRLGSSAPVLTKLAHGWSPIACQHLNGHTAARGRGRPRHRWQAGPEA